MQSMAAQFMGNDPEPEAKVSSVTIVTSQLNVHVHQKTPLCSGEGFQKNMSTPDHPSGFTLKCGFL